MFANTLECKSCCKRSFNSSDPKVPVNSTKNFINSRIGRCTHQHLKVAIYATTGNGTSFWLYSQIKKIIPLFGTYVTLIWRYNGGRGVTWRFLTLTLKFHLTTSSSHWLSLASTAFSTPPWLLEQTTGSLQVHKEPFITNRRCFHCCRILLGHDRPSRTISLKDRPNILKHGVYVK